ncbi:MAG TPA: hypothetical protein VJ780_09440 [Flavobacterium sp.]|nr:hypothetical protein [Flavobacterium sp.]
MKQILLALCLITSSFLFSQKKNEQISKAELTEAIRSALMDKDLTKDYPERIAMALIAKLKDPNSITDAELKVLIEKAQKTLKEIKKSKDYSIETNEVSKSEFDTVRVLKPKGIYQLKAETEGNYFVVKYIDNDLYENYKNYETNLKNYNEIKINDGEKIEEFKIRKEKALKEKDDSNPFKVYYGVLDPKRSIETVKSDILSFNLVTVPFKIFPKTDNIPSQVSGDIDNIGLYTAIRGMNFSTLRADGTEIKKSIGFGFYIAPSVIKLDEKNTGITGFEEVNKMYLTTALAVSLKYGNFTVMFIPAGVDTALSDSAKAWKYNGKFWWGFGLGVDTSLFNF